MIKRVSTIFLMIFLLTSCFGCSSQNEVKSASDLAGKTLEISETHTISFDVNAKKSIKTNFAIRPTSGKLSVKYIEGTWSNLTLNLYDTKYEDFVQTCKLEKSGDCITFSNLSGEYSYCLEVINNSNTESSQIILCFS